MHQLKDKFMYEFFRDKTVIILGSAPSVLDNFRMHIHSFDIIVRVNNYKIGEYADRVGSRTDVYYSYFGRVIKKTRENIEKDRVQIIMCKYPNGDFTQHTKGKALEGHSEDFRWVYEYRKDWWPVSYYIPTLLHFGVNYDILKRILTTGVNVIMDILFFNPKSVYITGFDFFKSKVHNVDEKWNVGDGNHDIEGERALVKKLVDNKFISCDKNILEVLNEA